MKYPVTYSEAKQIQRTLRKKIKIVCLKRQPQLVAGVDAAFTDKKVIAAACLYTYPDLIPVEDAVVIDTLSFPYIPGLLSFREGPALIKAVQKLKTRPDVILFDGQGIAHPLGMGIASHIGVLLKIPSIGCAKSRLVGEYENPGRKKGSAAKLMYQEKIVGTVLRTRENVKPVFVSAGHLIDLKGAATVILQCTGKYRLPEPIRRADRLSKAGARHRQVRAGYQRFPQSVHRKSVSTHR